MTNRTIVRASTALITFATTLILGGCAMTTPTDTSQQKTGQQLRTQLIDLADAGIAASGLPEGWTYGTHPAPRAWNPEAKEFMGASCSTASGETRLRFDIQLSHPPIGDPVEFVDKMGAYWAEQGYTVSYVGGPIIDPGGDSFAVNRADRPDGSLVAGAAAQNKYFVLTFYTECSTDPTVDMFAGPIGYREFDMLDPDPYHPTGTPTITPYPDR